MADADSTLKILVDVQGRLDDLTKALTEMRRLRVETAATGQAVRSGFSGLFGNIFGANLAVNAVTKAVSTGLNLVTGAIREANETFETSANLDVDLQGYMRLKEVVRGAGGDVGALNQAIERLNQSIAASGKEGGDKQLATFRNLGVDPVALQGMSVDERFARLARAVQNATDKTAAWNDLGDIIGDRTLPRLRAALIEVAESGFGSVSDAATTAEARGTSAIHSFMDTIAKNTATLKSKVVEDVGGLLGAFGYDNTVPQGREVTPADIARLRNIQDQREALKALQLDLASAQKQTEAILADPRLTDSRKLELAANQATQLVKLFQLLQTLRKQMPLDNQTRGERDAEIAGYESTIVGLINSARAPVSRYAQIKDQFEAVNRPAESGRGGNANFLSVSQGFGAGVMQWATSLGSTGEQVAAMMQSSIGEAVHGISDGIYGWVTGTMSFGEALANLGGSVMRALIDSVVQMGVQWVITGGLAKATLAGISALGSLLRGKETTEVIASEAAKKPALISNAAAANAGSFGMAAVIGLALLTAMMAAFGGFESGGYTGDMPTNMIAGVVHGQEGVLNAPAMRRLGVNNLNRLNAGLPIAQAKSTAFGGRGPEALAGGRESARNIHIHLDHVAVMRAIQEDVSAIALSVYDKRARG